MVHIKELIEQQSSLVNMEELASVALVMTNQGMVNPSQVAVHFTQNYGNKVDLPRTLPGLGSVFSVSENYKDLHDILLITVLCSVGFSQRSQILSLWGVI